MYFDADGTATAVIETGAATHIANFIVSFNDIISIWYLLSRFFDFLWIFHINAAHWIVIMICILFSSFGNSISHFSSRVNYLL